MCDVLQLAARASGVCVAMSDVTLVKAVPSVTVGAFKGKAGGIV